MRIFRLYGDRIEECEKIEKRIAYRLFSGVGLFETMKVLKGYPLFIEDHIERLEGSIKKVWDRTLNKEIILNVSVQIAKEAGELAVLKIILVEDKLEFFFFFVIDDYPYSHTSDLSIKIVDFERNPRSFSSGMKPISYFDNVVLREKANAEGFDEVILLSRGFIAEGTRSNLFWVKDGKIFTPPLELGILKGITRTKVIELCRTLGIDVQEAKIRPDELVKSDGVFLTSSLMGIAPVKFISFEKFWEFKTNKDILSLKSKFSDLELIYVLEKTKKLSTSARS